MKNILKQVMLKLSPFHLIIKRKYHYKEKTQLLFVMQNILKQDDAETITIPLNKKKKISFPCQNCDFHSNILLDKCSSYGVLSCPDCGTDYGRIDKSKDIVTLYTAIRNVKSFNPVD